MEVQFLEEVQTTFESVGTSSRLTRSCTSK